MGRKKRKAVELDPENDADLAAYMPPKDEAPPPPPAPVAALPPPPVAAVVETETSAPAPAPAASSSYAVTSHSAEIVGEDIYISEESEGEEEEIAEVVLAGSRMGMMRHGRDRYQPTHLMNPNRQWTRPLSNGDEDDADDPEQRERELAKLSHQERAELVAIEKARKELADKEAARISESQENAGRDPCLFSKRTAFDIHLDQIEDKPWNNGSDPTDYFNYGFDEYEWTQYAANQLRIRQELTDASKMRRAPDPNIVPVVPKTPLKQNPRVAVAVREDDADGTETTVAVALGEDVAIGPEMVKKEDKMDVDEEGDDSNKTSSVSDIGGGAWAAGAAPGSKLAKLIEEQERKNREAEKATAPSPYQPQNRHDEMNRYSNRPPDDYYGVGGGGGPPDHYQDHYSGPPPGPSPRGGHFPPNHGPPPSFRGRGRGGFRPPMPNNMPPPWERGRGRRGGFRGGYGGRF